MLNLCAGSRQRPARRLQTVLGVHWSFRRRVYLPNMQPSLEFAYLDKRKQTDDKTNAPVTELSASHKRGAVRRRFQPRAAGRAEGKVLEGGVVGGLSTHRANTGGSALDSAALFTYR